MAEQTKKQSKFKISLVKKIITYTFVILMAVLFLAPVIIVFYNSFKTDESIKSNFFAFITPGNFAGFKNYINGVQIGSYPYGLSFLWSVIITVSSTLLILLCTSMSAWYIVRTGSKFSKIIFALCIFSMVVPFQMVMFTLSTTADYLKLNNPFTICITYLGFGAGLSIFMFSGFVKNIPLEIEEAASIDGCNPFQMFFRIILPICKPIYISVGVLETMWIWNDFLLPYLTLDRTKFSTIPIHIQQTQGSFGQVALGSNIALVVISLLPVIIFYAVAQKHIIKGVMAGSVK